MYSLVLALTMSGGAEVPGNGWPVHSYSERPPLISVSKEVHYECRPRWSLFGLFHRLFQHSHGEFVSYPVATDAPHGLEPIPAPLPQEVKPPVKDTGKPGSGN